MRAAAVLLGALLASGTGATAADPALKALSDDDLVTIALQMKGPFDRWPAKRGTLGLHRGLKVVVETRCSDVCPTYTTAVIRYDVDAKTDCEQLGGAKADILMPYSIAMVQMHYCVPRVLEEKKLIRFAPYMHGGD